MRSRETEDLIQLCWRSSLRCPEDDRPVELRLYDRAQCDAIAKYLRDNGYPFDVTIDHVDIGLDDVEVKDHRTKHQEKALAKCQTDEERLEKAAWFKLTAAEQAGVRRERRKAEKIAAGHIVRGRGRPKKGG